ncbi:hypothetical protein C805_01971 [Eubacterium sp. 14-2]|nr:hypothetical protein C805_01971 [Eubacterium sp. 14-2]
MEIIEDIRQHRKVRYNVKIFLLLYFWLRLLTKFCAGPVYRRTDEN